MAVVLAISVGTRNVGLAVMKQRRLTDYRIRTFEGKWTRAKCDSIWDVVELLMTRHRVDELVYKIPDAKHCSENIKELVDGIKELGNWYNASTRELTLDEIRMQYADQEKGCTKEVMTAALIHKYPQLGRKRSNSKQSKAYMAKLVEAIACAELALKSGH